MSESDSKPDKLHRRALLQGLAIGTAALAAPRAMLGMGPAPRSSATPEPNEQQAGRRSSAVRGESPPWHLIAPLSAGAALGFGWRVAGVSNLVEGTVRLTVSHDSGARACVHICRRHGAPRGLAHTEQLDLILMNGGDGTLPTEEHLGCAVKTVALRIARGAKAPPGMLSHPRRIEHYGVPESLA